MKVLLKVLAGLATLVLLLVVVAFFFPRHYRIERSTVIKAAPQTIHTQVADMKAWRSWTVWHERDPQMKNTYSDQQAVVGAWAAWESKAEGNGKSTLTEVSANRVVYNLEFPDADMQMVGAFDLSPQPDGVKVVWSTSGDLGMNPLNRWFGLFLDKLMGPDFEAGLANLKRNLEK